MDISRIMRQLNTMENINNSKMVIFEGLNNFSLPIRKNAMVHIYGGESTGKTTFVLDLIKKNPDKIFLYIDTYGNITHVPDNCFLFRTNKEKDIVEALENIDRNMVDCIIIDSYSNILSEEENWDSETHIVMQKALERIHNIISNKNAVFILINTLNGKGKAFNRNQYLSINSICELELLNYDYDEKIIEVLPKKAIVRDLIHYSVSEEV